MKARCRVYGAAMQKVFRAAACADEGGEGGEHQGGVNTFMSEPPRYSEWRPHPWHGLPVGREPPLYVNAYIEITPFDLIKYEVDKASGYLRVDRPQRTSSQAPALYGFIPQTYCGAGVAALCPGAQRGD